MSRNPPKVFPSYDLTGIDMSRDFYRIQFTIPNPPHGVSRVQKAATKIPNDGSRLQEITSLRDVLFSSLKNGTFTHELYCLLLPDSAYAKNAKTKLDAKNAPFLKMVEAFKETQLARVDQGRLSPRTIHEYIATLTGLRCSSLHALCSREITEKTVRDLQRFWESRRPDGTMRSTKTVRNLISAVKQLLEWAAMEGYVTGKPWLVFQRQTVEFKRQPVFSGESMVALYKDMYINECPDAANLFAILCLTGCRVSEAIAICSSDDIYKKPLCPGEIRTRQSDIDFSNHDKPKLIISRALVVDMVDLTSEEQDALKAKGRKKIPKQRSRLYWKRTKTMDIRILDLSPVAREILEEQIDRYAKEDLQEITVRSKAGDRADHIRPIFLNRVRGKKMIWLGSDSVRKMYYRSKARLDFGKDLPPLKNTRNTKASSMACQGESAIKIRAQLGHGRDTETIERHYINYYPELSNLNVEAEFERARAELKQILTNPQE
jgi:integrase